MNVTSSGICPYQENQKNPKELCGCSQNCGLTDICLPWHHAEFAGVSKKAFYGIIAPTRIARRLKHIIIERDYLESEGIYTLILNQFASDRSDNTEEINIEIELFKTLREIDPEGEFTPEMFHHTVIQRNSMDMLHMHRMCHNIAVFHNEAYIHNALMENALDTTTPRLKKKDFEKGKCFIKLINECIGDLTLMFVSDAGKSLTDLCDEIKDKKTIVSAKDVIQCTRKLPENYAKLAARGIGHFDMHCNNICYKMKKNKPCLTIIDFGYNSFIDGGQESNFIHYLLAEIDFNYLEKHAFMRCCDPVHYYMFIACFEMMIGYFSQYNEKGLGNLTTLVSILLKMAQNLFSPDISDDEACAPALVVNLDVQIIQAKYYQFRARIKEVYARFYTEELLNNIWRRVCLKTHQAVMRYHYTHDEFITTIARISCPGQTIFSSNQYRKKRCADGKFNKIFPCVSYLPILDDFCMAYYDREGSQYDYKFLKQKFDEHSVTQACVFFLSSVYIVDDDETEETHRGKVDLMHEIDRIKMKFQPPTMHYEENSIEYSFMIFKHPNIADEIIPPPPPPPLSQVPQISPENDQQSLSTGTEIYIQRDEQDGQDGLQSIGSFKSLNFSAISNV